MKLYLAGPVTGKKDFAQRFDEGRRALRTRGYTVVCPVEGCDGEAQSILPWDYWMRRDIAMMLGCHGVALLPGWEFSEGVELEIYVAEKVKMPVFPIEEWLGKEPAEQLCLMPLYAQEFYE